MNILSKLERTLLTWFKEIPQLPTSLKQWLGANAWWIAVVGALFSGISVLWLVITLLGNIAALDGSSVSYYASTTFITWTIVTTSVSLAFTILECLFLSLSVTPLKNMQKKGWVLLFATWLLTAVSVVTEAILSLNPFSFVLSLLFGAIWIAVAGYFLYQIHGQFAHVERSKGVKAKK
ncbi:MAG: hypothetical protein WAR37_00565 [Candidatus Microsaccharimonas sp.]